MGLESQKSYPTDMTLVTTSSLRARFMDLQPLNDPFLVDNIFKSPKKRRRGLLSWSAMPTNQQHERPLTAINLWDFPRHVRARNRRRSILGSKYSMSSLKRRRPRSSLYGSEHARSASDPTSALSPMPPKKPALPTSSPTMSEASVETKTCTARPFIATTPSMPQEPEASHQKLHVFPKLRDDASIRSSYVSCLSESFTILPQPRVSSTLRGIPGLSATIESPQSPAPHTPYISISALRMTNETSFSDCGTAIRAPAPALLRTQDSIRTHRLSSLPMPDSNGKSLVTRNKQLPAPPRVIFDPARREMPHLPESISCDMVSPPPSTRFNMVKNSLEIRQPATSSAARVQNKSVASSSPKLPAVVRLLRRLALCGNSYNH
ncbi:hypothetical protein IWW36_004899 [Coemansia brasiliensis]|uniref:Uncharacterized protein n=1 Tax=Coemansia brasiliensis TaxID=2650707 RepID=A0A9W8I415_9FUNG|nr:hypothetical protein IWW36_004899 [Coemansia brasiliensis]